MADAPLAIGDLFEVRFEGQVNGNRWNNVRHMALNTLPAVPGETYAHLLAWAEDLHDAYTNGFNDLWTSACIFELTRIKRIRPTPSVFAFFARQEPGVVSGGTDEPDDAAVIRFYTSQAGRSRQGRTFFPGIPDANVNDGILDAGYASDLLAAADGFYLGDVTMSDAAVLNFYVYSRKLSDDGDPLTLGAYPITHVMVDQVVRRMTRRDHKYPLLVTEVTP